MTVIRVINDSNCDKIFQREALREGKEKEREREREREREAREREREIEMFLMYRNFVENYGTLQV